MGRCDLDVRFGSLADMCSAKGHVRFTPESGHGRHLNVHFVPIADITACASHRTFEVRLFLRQRCLIGPTGRRVLTAAPEMIQHEHTDRRRKVVSVAAVVVATSSDTVVFLPPAISRNASQN